MRSALAGVFLSVLLCCAGAACSAGPISVLSPQGLQPVQWTDEESDQEIAVRLVRETETSSVHLVRLAGAEKPHVHASSDLIVTVLSGRVEMHLDGEMTVVEPGQVIDIPRGTPHHAVNISSGVSEAHVVFSPPFRRDDVKPASGH